MKYSVMLGRTVAQSAFVEVEADSEEEAKAAAEETLTCEADWDNDDSYDYGVLHVHALTGEGDSANVEAC